MGFLDKLIGGGRALVNLPWQPSERPPERLSPVRLPRDERCHHHAIEWWYFMGYVDPEGSGDGSKRLSFIVSVIKGRVAGMTKLMGSVVLVDHAKKTHSVMTRLGLMGTSYFELHDGRAFQFHFGSAAPIRPGPPEALAIEGGMGTYSMVIDTSEQLVLEFDQEKGNPAVYLGEDGIMDYAGTDQMAYYLWPHLKVSGRWGTGRDEKAVEGQAWMEHQYGDIQLGDYHWRYLAVMFTQGDWANKRLIVFEYLKSRRSRDDWTKGEGKLHCVLIDADGYAHDLSPKYSIKPSYDTTPEGYELIREIKFIELPKSDDVNKPKSDDVNKRSENSPLRDDKPLTISELVCSPKGNGSSVPLNLVIKPHYPDQEHRTALPPSLFPSYWEGACAVCEKASGNEIGWAAMQVFGQGEWKLQGEDERKGRHHG